MNTAEFVIETAAPPAPRAGRPAGLANDSLKRPLVLQLQTLAPGQVLRWRSAQAKHYRCRNAISSVRCNAPSAAFTVRKENGGFDIYRTA